MVAEIYIFLQHANEDVEKMLLGNKADMEDKRQISTEKAQLVSYHLSPPDILLMFVPQTAEIYIDFKAS